MWYLQLAASTASTLPVDQPRVRVIPAWAGEPGGRELDLWLHRAGVDLVAVDQDQADVARAAYRTYGKSRHRAGLSYGDCFSYALAKISGQPLLFKGEDFQHTDIARASN